jgi:hypothetical protein
MAKASFKTIADYIAAVDKKTGRYLPELHADQLGKVSVGKSCIRLKRLSDVDLTTLKKINKLAAANPPYPLL